MKAISIVGYKKSGKTTLVYELLKEFKKMNLKVAVIKSTHMSNFDKQNTDTSKMSELADVVIGKAKNETFGFCKEEIKLEKIFSFLKSDIVLIEGLKEYKFFPRVIVFNESAKEDYKKLLPELAICSYGTKKLENLQNVKSIKKLATLIYKKSFLLPNLNCGSCKKKNCFEMAKDIVSKKNTIENCPVLNSTIEIKMNGKKIGANPFVDKVFRDIIVSMLKNLRGYEKGSAEISLKI